jgi:hypothetical protein
MQWSAIRVCLPPTGWRRRNGEHSATPHADVERREMRRGVLQLHALRFPTVHAIAGERTKGLNQCAWLEDVVTVGKPLLIQLCAPEEPSQRTIVRRQ